MGVGMKIGPEGKLSWRPQATTRLGRLSRITCFGLLWVAVSAKQTLRDLGRRPKLLLCIFYSAALRLA